MDANTIIVIIGAVASAISVIIAAIFAGLIALKQVPEMKRSLVEQDKAIAINTNKLEVIHQQANGALAASAAAKDHAQTQAVELAKQLIEADARTVAADARTEVAEANRRVDVADARTDVADARTEVADKRVEAAERK